MLQIPFTAAVDFQLTKLWMQTLAHTRQTVVESSNFRSKFSSQKSRSWLTISKSIDWWRLQTPTLKPIQTYRNSWRTSTCSHPTTRGRCQATRCFWPLCRAQMELTASNTRPEFKPTNQYRSIWMIWRDKALIQLNTNITQPISRSTCIIIW